MADLMIFSWLDRQKHTSYRQRLSAIRNDFEANRIQTWLPGLNEKPIGVVVWLREGSIFADVIVIAVVYQVTIIDAGNLLAFIPILINSLKAC